MPFILFTGKGSEEIASEAIAAGVTNYVQKNTGSDTYELLAHRIRNGVEQRRALEEAARTRRFLEKVVDRATDIIAVVSPWDSAASRSFAFSVTSSAVRSRNAWAIARIASCRCCPART